MDEGSDALHLVLLADLLPLVVAYQRCQHSYAGLAGICVGIAVHEALAAVTITVEIPPEQRARAVDQVLQMGRAVMEYDAARSSRRRRG